jgi:hypothetical protein
MPTTFVNSCLELQWWAVVILAEVDRIWSSVEFLARGYGRWSSVEVLAGVGKTWSSVGFLAEVDGGWLPVEVGSGQL